jgi:glycine cleavage system aminomethyltransferase T
MPARRLVGFAVREHDAAIEESLVVLAGAEPIGWITSTAFSPTLQLRVGMAMLPAAMAVETAFTIRLANGRSIAATRVELPFFDPTNSRQSI